MGPQGEQGPVGPQGEQGPQGLPGGDGLWDNVSGGINYPDGRVGIGTTTPQTNLHIYGSPILDDGRGQLSLSAPTGNDVWLSFYEDNTYRSYLWYNPSTEDLHLQVLSYGDLVLNSSGGNVGIGTSSPNATLDVDGNVNIQGDLLLSGHNEIQDILERLVYLEENSGAYTVTDIEGNLYKTVRIGDQVWMAENLKTTQYNDGSPIPLVTSNTTWGNLSSPGYCWYNNDKASFADVYGALYNWFTVNTQGPLSNRLTCTWRFRMDCLNRLLD